MPTAKQILALVSHLKRRGFGNNEISYFLRRHGYPTLSNLARMVGLGRRKRKSQKGRGGLIAGSAPRFWFDQLGRPIMFKSGRISGGRTSKAGLMRRPRPIQLQPMPQPYPRGKPRPLGPRVLPDGRVIIY